jgi:hypothetical protein
MLPQENRDEGLLNVYRRNILRLPRYWQFTYSHLFAKCVYSIVNSNSVGPLFGVC